ncbi:MAG: methionyl-tRNA formyltransferase [Chlamydiae bacterium]|nr:methionyl-tRNA formyltransferase [Chlamydiota bacterium]
MKIVFFGTSSFSAQILQNLLAKSFNIAAVVTRPDKPRGRSLQLDCPPVKKYLQDASSHIPIFQPEKASAAEFEEILRTIEADLFLVVAYGEILKQNILDLPKKKCINIHASLLPSYRGAAPIHRCIMNGDKRTGITIIEMVRQMDAGDILAQESFEISKEMNFKDVEARLLEISYTLLDEILNHFDQFYAQKKAQDLDKVTFAAKISQEDLEIKWVDEASLIFNKIRAFSPSPGAWCKILIGSEIKRIKIFSSKSVQDYEKPPGSLIANEKELIISCLHGAIAPLEVQLEGKKRMSISEFLKGLNQKISFPILE